MGLWASHLTNLSLSFLICQLGRTKPASQGVVRNKSSRDVIEGLTRFLAPGEWSINGGRCNYKLWTWLRHWSLTCPSRGPHLHRVPPVLWKAALHSAGRCQRSKLEWKGKIGQKGIMRRVIQMTSASDKPGRWRGDQHTHPCLACSVYLLWAFSSPRSLPGSILSICGS